MRITMIHAIPESIPAVKIAFQEEFPEAEVVNVLDDSLLVDFPGQLNPKLRRRMSQLILYCAEHGADAIGLACSVYAPVVATVAELVDVPLVSSYGPVMAEAVAGGSRIGIIASVPATLRDAEYYLIEAARERKKIVEPFRCLAEDLIPVMRSEGEAGLRRRLAEEVERLAPQVDSILLSQFSMAVALNHLRDISPVPVLSAPHSSARRLKELLLAA